jgi:hypothetical protein
MVGFVLVIYSATDHAAYNARRAYGSWVRDFLSAPLGAVRDHLGLIVFAALY